jgi:hypothetical protein
MQDAYSAIVSAQLARDARARIASSMAGEVDTSHCRRRRYERLHRREHEEEVRAALFVLAMLAIIAILTVSVAVQYAQLAQEVA